MTVFDGIWKRIQERGIRPVRSLLLPSSEEGESLEESLIARQATEIERLRGIVANTIKYPPEPSGLPLLTESDILYAYRGIIKETFLAVGMQEGTSTSSTPCFMNTYMPVIKNIIGYYHLLPASEYHHHNEAGGLLRHSLEVALMTLRYAKNSRPDPIGYQDIELLREPRWRFAAWLCGLLHDGGKIIYDMRVIGKETPALWNPQLENIFDFSLRHRIEKIEIQWRSGRINKYHENLSIFLMDSVLNDMSKRWLTNSNDNLYGPISEAMSFYSRRQDGYLETALRKADSLSAERDMKVQYHDLLGERKTGLAQSTINALRWCRKHQWTHLNNSSKARYFIIDEEVYIEREHGLKDVITKVMEYEKNKLVSNLTTATRSMEESGIIEVMHEESDFCVLKYLNESGNPVEAHVVRLSYPRIMFEDEVLPPNLTDCELILSQNQEQLIIGTDGAVSYKEILQNPFKTLYNTTERVERNPNLTMCHPDIKHKKKTVAVSSNKQPASVASNTPAAGGTTTTASTPATAATPATTSTTTPATAATPKKKRPSIKKSKPAVQNSGAVQPAMSSPKIKFENEDAQGEVNDGGEMWSGMNLGHKPAQAEESKPEEASASAQSTKPEMRPSLSPSVNDKECINEPVIQPHVRTPLPAPIAHDSVDSDDDDHDEEYECREISQSPSPVPINIGSALRSNSDSSQRKRLKLLPSSNERTLVYLICKGISESCADNQSLLTIENLESLHVQIRWIELLLSNYPTEVDEQSRNDLYKSIGYSSLGGGEIQSYLAFSKDHVRAMAELLQTSPMGIYDAVAKVNHFGRQCRNNQWDQFLECLLVKPYHEFEIINSDLARTLGLTETGVVDHAR